jgi:hypothetical protein
VVLVCAAGGDISMRHPGIENGGDDGVVRSAERMSGLHGEQLPRPARRLLSVTSMSPRIAIVRSPMHWGNSPSVGMSARPGEPTSSPNGIRTRVSTLRGWCPRPLDDGARHPFGPSQPIRWAEIPNRVAPGAQPRQPPSSRRHRAPTQRGPENRIGSGGRTRTPNNRARTCRVADYTTPEWVTSQASPAGGAASTRRPGPRPRPPSPWRSRGPWPTL